jgi:hypothetical protein
VKSVPELVLDEPEEAVVALGEAVAEATERDEVSFVMN